MAKRTILKPQSPSISTASLERLMMDELLVNSSTAKAIDSYIRETSGALMLAGPEGSGKLFLAMNILSVILKLDDLKKIQTFPYLLVVSRPEKKQDILVEQIREIKNFLKLKATGSSAVKRAVVIKDAQDMNEEAQNALLKILEEPNSDTLIILTARA